jgi:hypothetical protein
MNVYGWEVLIQSPDVLILTIFLLLNHIFANERKPMLYHKAALEFLPTRTLFCLLISALNNKVHYRQLLQYLLRLCLLTDGQGLHHSTIIQNRVASNTHEATRRLSLIYR